jgi:hypothetical protein
VLLPNGWLLSTEGVDALLEARLTAAKAIVRASNKNVMEALEGQHRLTKEFGIALVTLYVGFLMCFGLASYAVTGKPTSVSPGRFLRRWWPTRNASVPEELKGNPSEGHLTGPKPPNSQDG